jgi:hypothetical protein
MYDDTVASLQEMVQLMKPFDLWVSHLLSYIITENKIH